LKKVIVIDEQVEPLERGEVCVGRCSNDRQQLVAPSRQRLGQEMLLVLEEHIDRGGRESGLICNFAQRAIVHSTLTENLLGRIEDVDSVLRVWACRCARRWARRSGWVEISSTVLMRRGSVPSTATWSRRGNLDG
jgi:hypothetical protein